MGTLLSLLSSAFSIVKTLLGIQAKEQDVQQGMDKQALSDAEASAKTATEVADARSSVGQLTDPELIERVQRDQSGHP